MKRKDYARKFSDADVHYIRTSGIGDAEYARLKGLTAESVRRVRMGIEYQDHPTPPDTKPRSNNRGGRQASTAFHDPSVTRAMRHWNSLPSLQDLH